MNYVIDSFINYIFLFFVFCLLEIALLQYYKNKKIKIGTGFIIGYQIFVCLFISIFTVTGIPGIDNMTIQTYKHMNFILYIENIFSFECVMNMIMFIPLGVMIPLLWGKAEKLYFVIVMGFSLSLFIELSQLFNYRASDINDILTNVIGTLFGYILYKIFLKKVYYFKLDDQGQLTKFHIFVQIIMISFVYFLIGSPIISLMRGF